MPRRNDRIFFWHVPKTGGRWVEEALSRRWGCTHIWRVQAPRIHSELMFGGDHAPPSQIAEELKRGLFHFCFVRKPLSWYISWWAYRTRRTSGNRKYYCDRFYDKDCDKFINNMLDAHPGFVTELFQLYVGPNADQMDYVGHTENLLHDLKEAMKMAEQPIVKPFDGLAPVNSSSTLPHIASRISVSPKTIERVNSIEHWVLDTFYAT